MKMDEWLGSQAQGFRERDDKNGLEMIQCYVQGYQARETDPDGAFTSFSKGKAIAERMKEPWWALFYEKERIDAMLHFKRDYRNVLDMAVQAVLEVRKPLNTAYPGKLGIWDSLVAAYLGIDPEGYADEIQKAFDYLEKEIPPEPSGDRYLLYARQTTFAQELGDLRGAYDMAMRELDMASSDTDESRAVHFATFTYCHLCEIAAAIEQFDTVDEWSKIAEELAQAKGHHCEMAQGLAWQALAAQKKGDVDRASRCCQLAISHQSRLKMPPKPGYAEALAAYFEARGQPERALGVRQMELETIAARGRLLYETRLRISCGRLMAEMGELAAEAVDAAEAVARKLRKPEKYLAEIAQLRAAVSGA